MPRTNIAFEPTPLLGRAPLDDLIALALDGAPLQLKGKRFKRHSAEDVTYEPAGVIRAGWLSAKGVIEFETEGAETKSAIVGAAIPSLIGRGIRAVIGRDFDNPTTTVSGDFWSPPNPRS